MKTIDKFAAQGDIVIRRIPGIPKTATPNAPAPDGCVVVAHSETGHHHAFVHGGAMTFECSPPDPLVCYLRVSQPSALEHLRAFDTHEAILFPPGDYEIRRQREYMPQGWRRVAD